MTRTLLLALSLLAGAALPALAQNGPTGIAFAYAPEQGSGSCTGGSPAAALDCARQKCVAQSGAEPQDCIRVAWCFPAGWSVGIGIMHKEGIHWSQFSCGWPSREAAIAAGELRCSATYREGIRECVIGQLWNDDGKEVAVEDKPSR